MKYSTAFVSLMISALLVPAIAMADGHAPGFFKRESTFLVYNNLPVGAERATETAAEMVAFSKDGMTVLYSNSQLDSLGMIDITDPANPKPLGETNLGGEPTNVAVAGDNISLLGVNTSKSYTRPSGYLAVVDMGKARAGDGKSAIVKSCDVGGQPDDIAISNDGKYAVLAIENERDEDLNDGYLPQMPAGHIVIFDLDASGIPTNCDNARKVPMAGFGLTDPEPEFVDINSRNEAAVTMQENNHIAIVDLASGRVIRDFSAGYADLRHIDNTKDKIANPSEVRIAVPREPDAVSWLSDDRLLIANEGDYERPNGLKGGSRSFTIMDKYGNVLHDSGAFLEHAAYALGHYNDKRAHKKGVEPEGALSAVIDGHTMFFIGLERVALVAVGYLSKDGSPMIHQPLSTGVGPEGMDFHAGRGLLVVSAEEDAADDGVRSNVSLYQYARNRASYEYKPGMIATYPTVLSRFNHNVGGPLGPVAWTAMSGLAANPADPEIIYAVNDSLMNMAQIYTINLSARGPHYIVDANTVTRGGKMAENLDLEGIAIASDGGFWLASEGHPGKDRKNLLLKTDMRGAIQQEITLPADFAATMKKQGFEGLVEIGGKVYVAIQRAWKEDKKGHARIAVYDSASERWSYLYYPLDKSLSENSGWIGLSGVARIDENTLAIIERDKGIGADDALLKRVYAVDISGVSPVAGGEIPVVSKTLMADLVPMLNAFNGVTVEKVEGITVTADGHLFIVNDNDGAQDSTGETLLLNLGPVSTMMN